MRHRIYQAVPIPINDLPIPSLPATFAAVGSSDSAEDLDLTLRDVTRRFPEHLARALLPPGTVVTSARCSETQVTSLKRELDRGLEVVVDGKRRLEHIEWQIEMRADVPFRVYEYNALTSIALEAETPAGKDTPRIQSTVVLMSGRDKPWPDRGAYRTSPDDEPFSGVTFRIDPVYQRTVAELEARGPLWTIFAPLAVDADPVKLKAVVDRLRAEQALRDFRELSVAMAAVATNDRRQRGLGQGILAMLSAEDVMQSSVYQMGRQQGANEGKLEMLAGLYERRLKRSLTEGERTALAQRLEKLGADRLLDAPQELSANALAAWLAEPTAGGG
jgi:hypothetical protein